MVDAGFCVNPHRDAGVSGTDTRAAESNTGITGIHFYTRVAGTRVYSRSAKTLYGIPGRKQCLRSDESTRKYETSENQNKRNRLEI